MAGPTRVLSGRAAGAGPSRAEDAARRLAWDGSLREGESRSEGRLQDGDSESKSDSDARAIHPSRTIMMSYSPRAITVDYDAGSSASERKNEGLGAQDYNGLGAQDCNVGSSASGRKIEGHLQDRESQSEGQRQPALAVQGTIMMMRCPRAIAINCNAIATPDPRNCNAGSSINCNAGSSTRPRQTAASESVTVSASRRSVTRISESNSGHSSDRASESTFVTQARRGPSAAIRSGPARA